MIRKIRIISKQRGTALERLKDVKTEGPGGCSAPCPAFPWTGDRGQDLSPDVLVDKEGCRRGDTQKLLCCLSQKLREPASAGSVFGGSVGAELFFGQLLVFPSSSRNCRNVLCRASALC